MDSVAARLLCSVLAGRRARAATVTAEQGRQERRFAPASARPDDIARDKALKRLAAERERRLVLIEAPAGYGKSTFAAQMCSDDARPAAWINVRDSDNDPGRFLARLGSALVEVEGVDASLGPFDSVAAIPLAPDRLLARLLDALAGGQPVQLVLDDVHILRDMTAIRVVRSLTEHWPTRSRLVLVSRAEPDASIARLRAAHDLSEVRLAELALDRHETAEMLRRAGIHWPETAIEELQTRTEGWAAGVALAAMAHSVPEETVAPFSGARREVADYLFEEVLRQQSQELRAFMLSTSVVDRLSGPLCDAMTERTDSARLLAQLERTNAFLVPLDGSRIWFRYHHLFQEMLRAELTRQAPETVSGLLDRAAAWHETKGSIDEAFEYARAIGDLNRAGRVLLGHWDEYASRGRFESIRRLLGRCSDQEIESDPMLAIGAAWTVGHMGEVERTRSYLQAAARLDLDAPSPNGASSLRAALYLVRSAAGLEGVGQMLEDGLSVRASESTAGTRWVLGGYRASGTARLVQGQTRQAIDDFEMVVLLTEGDDRVRHVRAYSLGFLALAYGDLADWSRAKHYCNEAGALMDDHGSTSEGLPVRVAQAAISLEEGNPVDAVRTMEDLRPQLARASSSPPLYAELSTRCAEIACESGNLDVATAFYEGARRACAQLPDAGSVPTRLDALEHRMGPPGQRLASLTPAEMRVLRQLATHRKLDEIAEHLYVSRATIKTQVASIYTKLDVSTRNEAVEVLGLGARHLAV